jgi:hypothetical protein
VRFIEGIRHDQRGLPHVAPHGQASLRRDVTIPRVQESDQPIPPRLRWTKRGVWIFLIVLGLLLGLRFVWGYLAHRALEKEIAAIRARGEPTTYSDLDEAAIPDAVNAAWYLNRAANSAVMNSALFDINMDDIVCSRDLSQLGPLADAQQPAIVWIRKASQFPQTQWFTSFANSPNIGQTWNSMRALSGILQAVAITQHIRGNDAEALRLLHDEICLANGFEQDARGIIPHLFAVGIRAMAADTARDLAYDLVISSDSSPNARSASRQQVRDAITELLDEQPSQQGLIRGLEGERLYAQDLKSKYQPLPNEYSVPWPLLPLLDVNAVRNLRQDTAYIAAASVPSSSMVMPANHPPMQTINTAATSRSILKALANSGMWSFERRSEMQCQSLVNSRAAAIALAIRLYRFDHGEAFPKSLAQLVPEYLPGIPVDALSPSASLIVYKSETKTGPILYSVGANGVDDGGSEAPSVKGGYAEQWDELDLVFHLTIQPPATQPDADLNALTPER